MIAFLDGTIASKTLTDATIDVHGVGYLLSMSQNSLAALPPAGEHARILCHMSVSDAGISLFGFASEDEKELFEQLITISGIGPKLALSALSFFTPAQLVSAIVSQDAKALSKIPGVGKKSASRIILELKDKFPEEGFASEGAMAKPAEVALHASAVIEALSSMGFTEEEIAYALKDADEGLSESKLLKHALRRLG